MKNTKTLLGIVAVFLLLFGIYKLSTFAIFDEEFKEIEAISIPNKNYTIKIYHIPSNASSQSYIQIRKSENGVEEVLQNYDRYDWLLYKKGDFEIKIRRFYSIQTRRKNISASIIFL